MKAKIAVFFIAALFISTMFAGASVIQTKKPDQEPCPAANVPPGLWSFHLSPKGDFKIVLGEYKHLELDEDVTFKSEISFYQFGGGAIFIKFEGEWVKIPSVANRIKVTLKERKDGGAWSVICEEDIPLDQANGDGKYYHQFTKSYSTDGCYEVMSRVRAYGDTITHGEIYWDSGGGKLNTVTLGVGETKYKHTTIFGGILDFLQSILNYENILFERLLKY